MKHIEKRCFGEKWPQLQPSSPHTVCFRRRAQSGRVPRVISHAGAGEGRASLQGCGMLGDGARSPHRAAPPRPQVIWDVSRGQGRPWGRRAWGREERTLGLPGATRDNQQGSGTGTGGAPRRGWGSARPWGALDQGRGGVDPAKGPAAADDGEEDACGGRVPCAALARRRGESETLPRTLARRCAGGSWLRSSGHLQVKPS